MSLTNRFYVEVPNVEEFFKMLGASLKIYNVLLVGPPGTGKTSLAISVIDKLTGEIPIVTKSLQQTLFGSEGT